MLVKNSNGTLTLTDSDGTIYTFDALGNPQTVATVADSLHLAAATYSYDTSVSPPRVNLITDPVSGRTIHLFYGSQCPTAPSSYDATIAPNLLCQVSFADYTPIGGTLQPGFDQTATNVYYSHGMLAAIVNPGTETTQFGYTSGLMTAIVSPLTVDWLASVSGTASLTTETTIKYAWLPPSTGTAVANIRPAFSNEPAHRTRRDRSRR